MLVEDERSGEEKARRIHLRQGVAKRLRHGDHKKLECSTDGLFG